MEEAKHKNKSKKHKKSRHHSSSSDSEYQWTETSEGNKVERPVPLEENTWISDVHSVEGFIDTFTKSRPQKAAVQEEVKTKAVELNPYWKDGGTGVPLCENATNSLAEKSTLTRDNTDWLFKSYKRCLSQAKERNIPVRELLLERWNEATVSDMIRKFGSRGDFVGRRNRSRSPAAVRSSGPNRPRWRKASPQPTEKEERSETSRCHVSPPPAVSPSDRYRNPEEPGSSTRTQLTTETEEREVTDDDINEMAAKVLKAELTSNSTKAAKLKANLEKLREAKRRGIKVRLHVTRKQTTCGSSSRVSDQPTVVALTRLNDQGMEMPVRIADLPTDSSSSRKTKKFNSIDSTGHRTAYFPEDTTSKSVNDLLREEQFRSAHDMEYEFTKMAAKSGRNVDDEYADAFVPKRSHAERDALRLKQDAVAAYKRRSFAESSCTICLERVPKHLVISVGEKVFLSLPGHVSMTPGHCFLTPYEHIGSITRVDDCTLRELVSFKRQLVGMFHQQLNGSGCVFMETAPKPDSARAHAQIECIPVPAQLIESVPAYFKKALAEIGSEWDQNRRVIKLSKVGYGAHGAVPPKFPYFSVEFGLDGGGLARVLDDERDIHSYFGREVLADLLDKETRHWRKPKPEKFEQLRSKVVQFENWWDPFNKWSQHDPRMVNTQTSETNRTDPLPEGPELPPSLLP